MESREIVGVVADVRTSTSSTARPLFYQPTIAGEDVFGFISIRPHFDRAAEVHLIAVREEHHRTGVGRALLSAAEEWLRARDVKFLQVKTLSPSRECAHYARTRRFYEVMGFTPLEEFKTLWGERNPCLMMVKGL